MNTIDVIDIDGSIKPKAIEAFNHKTEYKYNNMNLEVSSNKIELDLAPVVYNWIMGKASSIIGIFMGAYKSVIAIIKSMVETEMDVFFGDKLVVVKDGKVVEKKNESSDDEATKSDNKGEVFNM